MPQTSGKGDNQACFAASFCNQDGRILLPHKIWQANTAENEPVVWHGICMHDQTMILCLFFSPILHLTFTSTPSPRIYPIIHDHIDLKLSRFEEQTGSAYLRARPSEFLRHFPSLRIPTLIRRLCGGTPHHVLQEPRCRCHILSLWMSYLRALFLHPASLRFFGHYTPAD